MKLILFLFFPFFGNAQSTTLKYKWRKISGPSQYKIESPDSLKTKVTNLVAGKYQFELKVTNKHNLSDRDTMFIIVNAPANKVVTKNEIIMPVAKF